MKTFLVVICLLTIQSAYSSTLTRTMPRPTQLTTLQSNLEFIDSVGDGVTEQMLKNYTAVINAAYLLYTDDVQSNARYIKQKLDTMPTAAGENYYVFIQTNPPIKTSYSIWMSTKRVFAGLNKVNRLKPDWSYFLLRTYSFADISEFSYLKNGILGPAINFGVQTAIMDIIQTFETQGAQCSCSKESITNIRKSLESYFNSYQFNVVCSSNGSTQALIFGIDGLWGTFKSECYYTIYKNL